MEKIDYTRFSPKGPEPEGPVNKRWWEAKESEIAQEVIKVVTFLGQNDSKRQSQYQVSTRMYGNNNLMGVNGLSYSKIASVQNSLRDRVSYNLAQSGVDTVVAKMAKNKPRPLFLTSGGDYKLQRRAKKLDKFCDGIFYENKAYAMGITALRDALVFGDGIVHVFPYCNRVKWERVVPSELFVDWVDAFYGEPRQLHRVKNVDRQVALDLFPEHKEAILNCSSATADVTGVVQNIADQISIVESWHLPSGEDAKDGIHCINIPNANLLLESWDKPYFPFAKLPWAPRMYGYWAQSACEQIQNIQLEINKLLWVIQRSMHLAGTFKILMENGSKIVKEHFSNDIGSIICYSGTQPNYIVPPIVPMEIYTHVQTLKSMGYEQLGVSMLSAASKKPEGLDSGKALREFNDIESDRFQITGQLYEKFFLDLAYLSIECAKGIYESEGKYQVNVPGKKFIETIDWKDIKLEDDEYIMKMFPVSSLPQDPSGRLATIQEYMQAGLIAPRQGRRLLDMPDLEQIENLQNSTEEYLHMILEKIVEDGEYTPPEGYDDLDLAGELGLEYYSLGKTHNLEEEKLDLLRQFIDQVNMLKAKSQPPPMPAPGELGQMPAPQGVPQAPPTNDMIPNVQGVA